MELLGQKLWQRWGLLVMMEVGNLKTHYGEGAVVKL
jgi:hypothetical protein